jgi:hypothetical protein
MSSGYQSTPRKVPAPADVTNIQALRDSIAEELGRLQFFSPFDTILPQITDGELSQVKAKLKINNPTAWITKEMGNINPGKSPQHEAAAFAGLSTVFNKVAKAVADLRIGVPHIRCDDSPTQSPDGETKYKTKPDACFVLKKSQLPRNCAPEVDRLHWKGKGEKPPGISWADIAGTMEYKKILNDENVIDVSLLLILAGWRNEEITITIECSKEHIQHVSNHGL